MLRRLRDDPTNEKGRPGFPERPVWELPHDGGGLSRMAGDLTYETPR